MKLTASALSVSVLSDIPYKAYPTAKHSKESLGNFAGFGTVIDVYSHFKPWIPLLYAAILSSGVAFTLQIVAQNKLRPTIASLLMSLESVFSVISGWVMLGERFTIQEGIGCVLMFTAVILAQIKIRRR